MWRCFLTAEQLSATQLPVSRRGFSGPLGKQEVKQEEWQNREENRKTKKGSMANTFQNHRGNLQGYNNLCYKDTHTHKTLYRMLTNHLQNTHGNNRLVHSVTDDTLVYYPL